jgi:hypothetical protein
MAKRCENFAHFQVINRPVFDTETRIVACEVATVVGIHGSAIAAASAELGACFRTEGMPHPGGGANFFDADKPWRATIVPKMSQRVARRTS